jgi:hypothetical protein
MSNLFRPPSPPPMPAPIALPAPPPAPVLSYPVQPLPGPRRPIVTPPETVDTPVNPPPAAAPTPPTPPARTAGPATAPGTRSSGNRPATGPRRRWRPDTLVTSWRGVLDPRPGRPTRKTLLGE